jgi:hypothetical protein
VPRIPKYDYQVTPYTPNIPEQRIPEAPRSAFGEDVARAQGTLASSIIDPIAKLFADRAAERQRIDNATHASQVGSMFMNAVNDRLFSEDVETYKDANGQKLERPRGLLNRTKDKASNATYEWDDFYYKEAPKYLDMVRDPDTRLRLQQSLQSEYQNKRTALIKHEVQQRQAYNEDSQMSFIDDTKHSFASIQDDKTLLEKMDILDGLSGTLAETQGLNFDQAKAKKQKDAQEALRYYLTGLTAQGRFEEALAKIDLVGDRVDAASMKKLVENERKAKSAEVLDSIDGAIIEGTATVDMVLQSQPLIGNTKSLEKIEQIEDIQEASLKEIPYEDSAVASNFLNTVKSLVNRGEQFNHRQKFIDMMADNELSQDEAKELDKLAVELGGDPEKKDAWKTALRVGEGFWNMYAVSGKFIRDHIMKLISAKDVEAANEDLMRQEYNREFPEAELKKDEKVIDPNRERPIVFKKALDLLGAYGNRGVRNVRSVASGTVGTVAGIGSGLEALGQTQFIKNIDPFDNGGKTLMQKIGETIADKAGQFSEDLLPEDVGLMDEIMSAGGSTLAFFLPGLGIAKGIQAVGLLGKTAYYTGLSVSTVLESFVEGGIVYKDAIERGVPNKEAVALGSAASMGNLPAVFITNRLGLFGDEGTKIAKKLGLKLGDARRIGQVLTAGLEGSQEFFQGVVANIASNDPIFENGLKNMTIGSIVGGGISLMTQDAVENLKGLDEGKKIFEDLQERLMSEKGEAQIFPEGQPDDIVRDEGGQPIEINPQDPLIEEAKKYKTAEEFVDDILSKQQNIEIENSVRNLEKEFDKSLLKEFGISETLPPLAWRNIQKFGVGFQDKILKTYNHFAKKSRNKLADEIRFGDDPNNPLKDIKVHLEDNTLANKEVLEKTKNTLTKLNVAIDSELKAPGQTVDVDEEQLTSIWQQAHSQPLKVTGGEVTQEEPLLLLEDKTTKGEGFVMSETETKQQSPEVVARRELKSQRRKAAMDRIKEEIQLVKEQVKEKERARAEGKIKKIETSKKILDRRRDRVRGVQEMLQLSDSDIKKISRKDIRLMDNFEFKRFIDDFEARASSLAKTRQLKNEVIQQINDKELVKVDNLRLAMELPPLDQMTDEQLESFNNALIPFQKGDEFLSQRKLETVDNTELKGIKTLREAREKLSEKIGIPIEQLQTINVSPLDRFSFDTQLANKNPFYQFLVDEYNASLLDGSQRFIEFERELDRLVKKARNSRSRGLLDKAIPTDKVVFEYLESPTQDELDGMTQEDSKGKKFKEQVIEQMTDEEVDLANYLQSNFADALNYLLEHKVMEEYQKNYITHIRRGFLETWREDGLLNAFKEVFKQYQEDEITFQVTDTGSQNILSLEKFFQFAMKRTGNLTPSQNVAKAAKEYFKALYKKQSLDKIIPALDIYAYSLSPKEISPNGMKIHNDLQSFVREWINNKKGKKSSLGKIVPQGGKIDISLRSLNAFITLLDLGLNIPVGLTVAVGEQVSTLANLGGEKYKLGLERLSTPKGKKIVQQNESLTGKTLWAELSDTSNDIGDLLNKGMYGMFHASAHNANRVHLLGSLTKQEWENGEISKERLAKIKREIGRFRHVEGSKSIFGSTSVGNTLTKYKSWALPILNTVVTDINKIQGMLARGDGKDIPNTREFQELLRGTLITSLIALSGKSLIDDDDDSFFGKIVQKAHREALTLLGSLDPKVLTNVRLVSWLNDFSTSLRQIITLEEYKTKKGLKGVEGLKRTIVPGAVRQLLPKSEFKTKGKRKVKFSG